MNACRTESWTITWLIIRTGTGSSAVVGIGTGGPSPGHLPSIVSVCHADALSAGLAFVVIVSAPDSGAPVMAAGVMAST